MDTLEIKLTIEDEERLENEQALAYSQVYRWIELCEAESPSMISKIPQGFRDYLAKHRRSDMTVDIDPKIPIKEQIGEQGLALIALIVTNYWREEYPTHSGIYDKNELDFRLKKWNQLKKRMQQVKSQNDGRDIHRVSYNEVYWLLEHLPDEVGRLIPVYVLVEIRNKRSQEHICDLSNVSIDELSIETISLLKNTLDSANIQWK